MATFQRLVAWQLAHKLVLAIYRATTSFPPTERFGLVSQMRRAAFSVAANIAEGHAKRGDAELRRFLDIAVGSLSELAYCLLLARDLGYITESEWRVIEDLRDETGRTTWGLYRSACNRLRSA